MKSTGKGALSLWVRNMDSFEMVAYKSSFYSGPALKAGAGVTGAEFAAGHGYRVVTGDSPTITLAGGYTQGGGHSQLSGLYGIRADQVIEWEIATASACCWVYHSSGTGLCRLVCNGQYKVALRPTCLFRMRAKPFEALKQASRRRRSQLGTKTAVAITHRTLETCTQAPHGDFDII